MDPMSLLMAGTSLGGGILNNLFAGNRQQEQENFAQQMVSQQEAFQERMSNTAYQRATSDMKAAGLNPMMMYGSGSQSSTPSGAMGVTQQAPVSDMLGPAVSTAMQAMKLKQELAIGEQQVKNLKQDELVKSEQVLNTAADTWQKGQKTRESSAVTDILKQNVEKAVNEALQAKNERPYLQSAISQVLAPTAKAATDVYKLIPPIRLNVNSGKRGSQWSTPVGDGETSSFDSRFGASFGR